MRFNRLVIEAGQAQVSLAVHDRLTVVAGAGHDLRALLVRELRGGLDGTRSGLRADLTADDGTQLAVHRPNGQPHRVLNVTSAVDETERFRTPDGRVDVLHGFGVDASEQRDLLYVDESEIAEVAVTDRAVTRLADVDQTELWSTAARVRITDEELQEVEDRIGSAVEDQDAVAEVERHHHTLESAIEQHRQLSRRTLGVAVFSFIAALMLTSIDSRMPLVVLAIGTICLLLTFVYWARIAKIRRSEKIALSQVGADSYLSYTVKRVNGMFSDTEHRRRKLALAEDHRNAAIHWTRLAGDVSVDWAIEHHAEIERAAKLRHQLRHLTRAGAPDPALDDQAADYALALVSHLDTLRELGPGGESFPLIIDDPLHGAAPSTRLALLELLARSAGNPQIILLTDQDDVASWARLEALTGEIALVEPTAEPIEPDRRHAPENQERRHAV